MATFVDATGRRWRVHLEPAVQRLRSWLEVDLPRLVHWPKALAETFFGDRARLADILWCCCADEALAIGMTDEDFGRMLAGCSKRAAQALGDAVMDYQRFHAKRGG